MNQRFLMWGLASIAFVVTLAISSWQEGLWPSDGTITRGNRAPALASIESTELPARPFAPEHPTSAVATPAAAVVTPPPQQAPAQTDIPAPAESPPPMPVAEAEVDTTEFLAHRDRASQHSSRAR